MKDGTNLRKIAIICQNKAKITISFYQIMLFGKRIKELRESQKLPQRVVADALEITIPLYSRVERGERTLSKSHLPKLAQVLNVEENELLKLYLADCM